jgi:hypothetical protein
MEARQQRIESMVKNLLPCIEACGRKERAAKVLITITLILYALFGGYMFNELNRTIDYNEFVTLNGIVEITAQHKHVATTEITTAILTHYHIDTLQDLKARHWHKTLKMLMESERR